MDGWMTRDGIIERSLGGRMGFWIGIVVCHREYECKMSRLLIKHDGDARVSNAFGDSSWNLNSGSIMRHC